MVLKGLTIPIWIGWICGIVVLKRPWGSSILTSWLTFSTFNCLFGLLMNLILMADFFLNNSSGLTMGDNHKFNKYVRAFALVQYIVITFLKRVTFLKNAKQLGTLMNILSEYDKHHENYKRKVDKWGWRKKTVIVPFLIYGSLLISILSIVTKGVEFVLDNVHKPSWIKVLGLGTWGYGILYFIFAVVPLGIVSNIGYSIILVASLCVSRIFSEFCHDVKDSLATIILGADAGENSKNRSNVEIYSILKMGSKLDWERRKNGGKNKIQCMSRVGGMKFPERFFSRQEVIEKFEDLKELMKMTNDTLSAMMLWTVSGMTLGMVANASSLFTGGQHGTGINLVADILTFPLLSMYAMVLELGHRIGRMQRTAKLELQKELLNMPWSLEKDEMEDVIQEIIEFEWKLSACGFFNVDRKLASGIFSLVLNYVVILVQLNIALNETPPISCLSNGTLSNSSATI